MKRVLRYLYSLVPFKRHLFHLLRSTYTPSQEIYQHLHFKGEFKVKVDSTRNFKIVHHGQIIENQTFWNGLFQGWEKYSMRIWKELCEGSTVIFDVGANTGLYSLVAKATQPTAKVYAFEPVERVFAKLERNVQLNEYDILCTRKAISNTDGKAVIYDTDSEHILSVAVNKNISLTPDETYAVEIDTTTLDSFIDSHRIEKIDLMKIDVETHEVEALKGFRNHVQKFQPTLLIEILNDEVAKGVEEIISSIDYYYFNIDENAGIREVSSLGKSDYYNFLICKSEVAEVIRSIKSLFRNAG